MSRLQAGALSVVSRRVALDEVVPLALDDLGPAGASVVVDVPDDLPRGARRPGPARAGHRQPGRQRHPLQPARTTRRASPAAASASAWSCGSSTAGPGIPPAELDRVFAPFQRLGDTDNTTGVGLGLALSRGLTEAMGGTLTPEETPGGGLTMVRVVAGCAARSEARPTAAQPGRREREGATPSRASTLLGRVMNRVLVVDDEPQILRALAINLRARHYEVFTAATGADALADGRLAPAGPGRSSTSGCPTSTASRSSAGCAAGPRVPSSSSPGAPTAPTRSTPSTPAPTTTSPSRSAWTS